MQQVRTLAEGTEYENEHGGGMENGNRTTTTESTVVKDKLKELSLNKSTSLTQQSDDRQQVLAAESDEVHMQEEVKDNGENLGQTLASSEANQDGTESLVDKTVFAPGTVSTPNKDTEVATLPSVTASTSAQVKGVNETKVKVNETKVKVNENSSQSSDQLRQLLLNTTNLHVGASAVAVAGGGDGVRSTSPSLLSPSLLPGDGSSGDGVRESDSPSPVQQEPKRSTADAQVSDHESLGTSNYVVGKV